MDTISNYFKPFEDFLSGIVNYSLQHANVYVVVGILSIIALPFYMLFNAITTVISVRARQSEIKGKNILYVIAHPDDESM